MSAGGGGKEKGRGRERQRKSPKQAPGDHCAEHDVRLKFTKL